MNTPNKTPTRSGEEGGCKKPFLKLEGVQFPSDYKKRPSTKQINKCFTDQTVWKVYIACLTENGKGTIAGLASQMR